MQSFLYERVRPHPLSIVVLQVDPAEWRLEVERVAPRLKITVASNARDWRSHLDEAHKHSQEISTIWPNAEAALGAVQTEVSITSVAGYVCCHLFTVVYQTQNLISIDLSAGLGAAQEFGACQF